MMRKAFANTLEKDLWNGKKPKELEQTGSGVVVGGRVCAQSCPPLCDPMNYSLPGSSVHGILQARILECVAISISRGSFLT